MSWATENAHKQVRVKLANLGLPYELVELIKREALHDAIAQAYAKYDSIVERMDAWEAEHPNAAAIAPWKEGREAWKAAGRPRPEWWEVLRTFNPLLTPINPGELFKRCFAVYRREFESDPEVYRKIQAKRTARMRAIREREKLERFQRLEQSHPDEKYPETQSN